MAGLMGKPTVSASGFVGEPVGWTRVVDRRFSNANPTTDDLTGRTWFDNSGSKTLITDETTEPISPNTAYDMAFTNGQGNGDNGFHQTAVVSYGQDIYVGLSLKASANWDNTPLNVTKLIWLIGNGGRNTVLKMDGTSSPYLQVTFEHGGTPGVQNSSTDGSPNISQTISRGAWHTFETKWHFPSSENGTGTCQMWVDRVNLGTWSTNMSSDIPTQIQVAPYIGGVGTHAGPDMSIRYGHLISAVP